MHDEKVGVPTKIINNYCWIMNTFSLPDHYSGEKNVDFIHHGVGEIIFTTYKFYQTPLKSINLLETFLAMPRLFGLEQVKT